MVVVIYDGVGDDGDDAGEEDAGEDDAGDDDACGNDGSDDSEDNYAVSSYQCISQFIPLCLSQNVVIRLE